MQPKLPHEKAKDLTHQILILLHLSWNYLNLFLLWLSNSLMAMQLLRFVIAFGRFNKDNRERTRKRKVNKNLLAKWIIFKNQLWGYPWANPSGNGTIWLVWLFSSEQCQKICQLSDLKKWHIKCGKCDIKTCSLSSFLKKSCLFWKRVIQSSKVYGLALLSKTGGILVRVRPVQGPLTGALLNSVLWRGWSIYRKIVSCPSSW